MDTGDGAVELCYGLLVSSSTGLCDVVRIIVDVRPVIKTVEMTVDKELWKEDLTVIDALYEGVVTTGHPVDKNPGRAANNECPQTLYKV